MGICPLCNGLRSIKVNCKRCNSQMIDRGKIMDYYDDYSPYMDIDTMKMEDGYPDTFKKQKCPHLYYCSHCLNVEVILVKE